MSEKSAVTPPASEAAPWRPLPEVWAAFATKHPEFYLGTAPGARSRFCSRHGPALIAAGVLLKTRGNYYVRPAEFEPLAYRLVLGLPLAEVAEAAA